MVGSDQCQQEHHTRSCAYPQRIRSTLAIVPQRRQPGSIGSDGRRLDSGGPPIIVQRANAGPSAVTEHCAMPVGAIVSYDGTANDDDALALGRMLAPGAALLSLAYVRHAHEYDPQREEIAQHDAERRLAQGAAWLDDPEIPRHVVVDPSTGAGLGRLAATEAAALIVFGSDYRTPPGRVEPGSSAQQLLQGGSVAVAVAAAGLRAHGRGAIETVAAAPSADDGAPQATAAALAEALGARVTATDDPDLDLVIVGSAPNAMPGRIALSGPTRSMLDSARSSVLVLARATPILP
jgi:hypothetical protein